MTDKPTPPDGYELTDDEPVEGDMAWVGTWETIDRCGDVDLTPDSGTYLWRPAHNLRWIARKKK